MSTLLISILLIFFVSSYIAVICLIKRYLVLAGVLLTVFWLLVTMLAFNGIYFFSPSLSRHINSFIRPTKTHVTLGGEHAPLPLPPATALSFRSSHESAEYYCRLTVKEVARFYEQKASDLEIKSIVAENDGAHLLLEYEGDAYSISLTPAGKSTSFILVKSILEDT